MAYDFERLDVEINGRIGKVTIDNPPINLMTRELYVELLKLSQQLESDPDLSVVILRSANPEFFIAHFDVQLILQFPTEGEAQRSEEPNPFHQMCERFRTMNKLVIAQLEGRVAVVVVSSPRTAICAMACSTRPSSIRWKYRLALSRAAPAPSACRVSLAEAARLRSFSAA